MVANAGGKKLSSLPFPAIVGQEELKRVLLAVAVNDDLDGALVAGEKGTAKSTAVRGLTDLLPEQRAVADCPYGCSPDDPRLQCTDCRARTNDGEITGARAEVPIETRPVPLVTLPLGATRDRVVGTLSVEDALAGEADFDPGLLARAHRGILYVDEVNLLDDHLVDIILDAAASGVNAVERDGMSVSHPAEFTLVGTMNPEEGDLRPQLRDRFALQATVEGCREIEDRVEIIDRSLGLGLEPDDSTAEYAADVRTLRNDLAEARERLPSVDLPADFKADIARLCLEAGVDGHRGDVATARTARTIAALEGRTTVIEPDVREAASYTLPHRLRSTPFEETPDLEDLLEEEFEGSDDAESESDDTNDGEGDDGAENGSNDAETAEDGGDAEKDHDEGAERGNDGGNDGDGGEQDSAREQPNGPSPAEAPDNGESASGESDSSSDPRADAEPETGGSDDESYRDDSHEDGSGDGDGDDDSTDETATPLLPGQRAEIGEADAPNLEVESAVETRGDASGGARASATPTSDGRGARVRTEPVSEGDGGGSIDAAASVRSAASRGESTVGERDLRRSVRSGDAAVTIVFAVDASASMAPAMRTAKGVVLELLRDSYQHRDEVAFVAFAGDDADVLLPPTDSVTLAARHLKDLPSGDRTPLPAGLETTRSVLERTDAEASVVVLVTDGGANVADETSSPTEATRRAARRLRAVGASVVVVDAGDDSRSGLSELVAAETDGELVSLSSLSVETVRSAAESATKTE
ncbi:VWA domain-containing protein [Halostagnicola kamekurae]|uniref:Protoporphyrin IX magnesium-chelatase n=1 Tax=Halostagnicola kamekurae TaxID=619731 RepID=A0A1I6SH27_9EURY|nr:VWA domain-containing protein [Halostagnicola kamekurae]SFS76261.1 protoporphyrin IX magnesium-chelatase [Halostagnicola kamekurae]